METGVLQPGCVKVGTVTVNLDNVTKKHKLRMCLGLQDEKQELSHDSIACMNCALPITKTISVIEHL